MLLSEGSFPGILSKLAITRCQMSIIRCQWTVNGCQFTIINCRPPIMECPMPFMQCQMLIIPCWSSINGCQLPIIPCQSSINGCQLPIIPCQSLINGCQLPVSFWRRQRVRQQTSIKLTPSLSPRGQGAYHERRRRASGTLKSFIFQPIYSLKPCNHA